MNLTKEDRVLATTTFRDILGIDEVQYASIVMQSREYYLIRIQQDYWQFSLTFKQWYYRQFAKAICNSMLECGVAFDQDIKVSSFTIRKLTSCISANAIKIHKYKPGKEYIKTIEDELEQLMAPQLIQINKLINNITK